MKTKLSVFVLIYITILIQIFLLNTYTIHKAVEMACFLEVDVLKSVARRNFSYSFYFSQHLQHLTQFLDLCTNQQLSISFLFFSENPVAQRQRKKWINVVLAKRKNWEPWKMSSLCSIHFKEEIIVVDDNHITFVWLIDLRQSVMGGN